MKPIGAANSHWQAATANAVWRARALQKPMPASDLYGESQGQPEQQKQSPQTLAEFSLHQSGTPEHVPFRYAPRLSAPFTAQLLGQILPDPERRVSAAHLYGREAVQLCLGLDTLL
jgi:hypothetical protein